MQPPTAMRCHRGACLRTEVGAGSDALLMVATALLALHQEEICQCGDFADIATYFQVGGAATVQRQQRLSRWCTVPPP